MSWQAGLVVAILVPLLVFVVTVCWPDRVPKGRSAEEIRARLDAGEDEDPLR
ncbi:hypothetical protein NONO_c27610 [Nocardia nova SH22a]|uniref:Uncharacterized protein n=1 Tax=Nocardia nova SH22a TaxID=1415166 RepID=W5TEX6_9NOCA|nr:hypothetical protein [Nocardia nova]AHH17553.1 hypothetical protein NONO_c27610 [Nocardia nova SH22a]